MSQAVAHDLKEIDERILTTLAQGRNVPSNLAEELDVSRQWINQRLQQMESADYVRNVGRGVYELQPVEIPDDELDRLGITLDEVSALVAERDRLAEELEECREELADCRKQSAGDVDAVALQRALNDIEAAAERGDGNGLQEAIGRAREALDG